MYSNQIPVSVLFLLPLPTSAWIWCTRRHVAARRTAAMVPFCSSDKRAVDHDLLSGWVAPLQSCSKGSTESKGQGRRHCTLARRLRLLAGAVDTPLSGRPTQQAPAQLSTSKSLTPGRCVPRSSEHPPPAAPSGTLFLGG